MLLAVSAVAPAVAAAQPPTSPPARGWGHGRPGVTPASYTEAATIAPDAVESRIAAVVKPSLGVEGEATLDYGNETLHAEGSLTAPMPELNATVEGYLRNTVSGEAAYSNETRRGAWVENISRLEVRYHSESQNGSTLLALNLTGVVEREFAPGSYFYQHLALEGPVHYESYTNATAINVTFDLDLDLYLNATRGEEEASRHLWGTVTVDFNTGVPMLDQQYASALAMLANNLITRLGLQDNVTVTTDLNEGAVTISLDLYLSKLAEKLREGLPGIPVNPPGPTAALAERLGELRGEVEDALSMYEGYEGSLNVTYNAEVSMEFNNTLAAARFTLDASGIPEDLVGVTALRLHCTLSHSEEENTTTVNLSSRVEGLDSPAPAFYKLARLAKLGLYRFEEARAEFTGVDGVSFIIEPGKEELSHVVITSENRTLINRLRLVYNGTVYGVGEEGEVVVRAPKGGEAVVHLPGARGKLVIHNAVKTVIKAGRGRSVAVARELNITLNNTLGQFKVKVKNLKFKGQLAIATLKPEEAASLLPGQLRRAVAGPAIKVEGALEGGGEVEIPLAKTPREPALARVHPNGKVEIIRNVTVENGVLKATVPGFSTLVPVDLAEAGQPPSETTTTTTTTTTTETLTTSTATQPPATTQSTTTTTTTQTPGATTATTGTEGTTTHATETTSEAATSATETGTTEAAGQGGGTTTLIAAALVVLILAAAAAALARK
ncbi:hypothetical protein [Stetteria hydrogenophila]